MSNYFGSSFDVMSSLHRYENMANEIAAASTANEVCKHLEAIISVFIQSLNNDEEVGIALTSFGVARQIVVENIRAVSPNLLQIDGYENKKKVILLQHISQLSFLLIPVKISSDEERPRRKIGFQTE